MDLSRTWMRRSVLLGLALWWSTARAHEPAAEIPTVVVQGSMRPGTALSANPEALPATVEIIEREAIESMPVSQVLDLFRSVPGVVIRNLGQGDIGDDFGLRGFSGGHGTDIAVFVDGIPVNQVNGRTHGLSDLNGLLPEMIERLEVIKGPFSARSGNFALGGSVNIVTRDTLPDPELALSAGSYGLASAVAGLGSAHGLTLIEGFNHDGYRDNAESRRYGLFSKYRFDLGDERSLSLRAQGTTRAFGAPGYLPVEAVRDGSRRRTDAINDSDGGDVDQLSVAALFQSPLTPSAHLHASIFGQTDERTRYATFSADGTGQGLTATDGDTLGWRLEANRRYSQWLLSAGSDGRYDETLREAFQTDNDRRLVRLTSSRTAQVFESGLWAEAQWRAFARFKTTLGLRYDRFDSEVDNRLFATASGSDTGSILSPKLGAHWAVLPWLELYANRGEGFRSASQVELSPDVAGSGFNELEPFAVVSHDLGAQMALSGRLSLALAAYWTETEGEFVQTAPGEFENAGGTRRDGFEVDLRWKGEAFDGYLSWTGVDARLQDAASGADQVSGIPKDTQSLGGIWRAPLRHVLDISLQRYGSAPLDPQASSSRPVVTRVSAKLSRDLGRWGGFLQLAYAPNEFASESQFLISGASAFDPDPRFDLRIGLRYSL